MEPAPIATFAVIAITVLVSVVGFGNPAFVARFLFAPEPILRAKQGYRLVTSAFLHADWWHLLFNMYSLYMFGRLIELAHGTVTFLAIYFSAVIGGSLLSLLLHRHHVYRAYGASGGVCGIIFAYIFLFPGSGIMLFFIPMPVPGWLYAILYLLYSFYGAKRGTDNIGHDAHLGGAIIGLLTATALYPYIVTENPQLYAAVMIISLGLFLYLLKNPLFLPLRHFESSDDAPRRPVRPPPRRVAETDNVDVILEKIAKSGINSLTRAEQQALERASQQRRKETDGN